MNAVLWLKLIGWILFCLPILAFAGFSVWMIREAMNDDENIGIFVGLMGVVWIVGAGILVLTYFTDFSIATR
jgi:hypothetical protein